MLKYFAAMIIGTAVYMVLLGQVYDFSWWLYPLSTDDYARGLVRAFGYGTIILMWVAIMGWTFFSLMTTRYRTFTFEQLTTTVGHGFSQYGEWFIPDGESSYVFPADRETDFWINLEDIDDGRAISSGTVYQVNPVYYMNLHDIPQSTYDDLVHVTVSRTGHVTATFINGDLDTRGQVKFSVSEAYDKKNTSVTNDVQVTK